MKLRVGYVKSASQINLKEIDTANNTSSSVIFDITELKDRTMNLLLLDHNDELENVQSLLDSESKFYPVTAGNSLGLDKEAFDSLGAEEIIDLYAKVNARWILNNNIHTIEQVYSSITYLKDLWINDRNSFFEELWFMLKTNLASSELNIIFHDLKEPTDKQKEKGDKASLCYSKVTGEKTPEIFDGKPADANVMKNYENDFNDIFDITEFDSSTGQLVATAKIDLSPVLIMAKLHTFNQLQRSILIALFSGLQTAQA